MHTHIHIHIHMRAHTHTHTRAHTHTHTHMHTHARTHAQGGLWSLSCLAKEEQLRQLGYVSSDVFLAAVSIAAALGFLLYGGRLFLMLQVRVRVRAAS